ncbi:MAG: trehalose-6-phosphate synthase [Candidatus Tectimicrobiota bacterium]
MFLSPLRTVTRPLRMGLLIAGLTGLLLTAMAWMQVERERRIDLEDIERRAHGLLHYLTPFLRDVLAQPASTQEAALASHVEGYRRLLGLAVYASDGQLVAAAKGVHELLDALAPAVERVLQSRQESRETVRRAGTYLHILASGVQHADGTLQGVVLIVHDIAHIDERSAGRLSHFVLWLLLAVLLLVTAVAGSTWLTYDRPLQHLATWMQRLHTEHAPEAPPPGLPLPQLRTESNRLAVSFRAARTARWMEARSAIHEDQYWSRDRLRAYALDSLQGGQLLVVSNREPYMHQWQDGQAQMIMPAGGLVTALDPILQACGGVWVAHGAGDADVDTADTRGRLQVPPAAPCYTLRRVWLTREEEQGYYYGFANEGLWPLCHLAHERPCFRAADWTHYVQVNQRFAAAVLDEISAGDAVVLVQDYHLALVPRLLKMARPDLRVGLFWHIPWPNSEAFRICPTRAEILEGMLGADLLGFHLQNYCNNFLETVDRLVESRLDWDHCAIECQGHTTLVRPHPISVEPWAERGVATDAVLAEQIATTRLRYGLGSDLLLVGVDRIDYTKGLPERLRAVARFFEKYPQYRQRVTFVQLGAPSRTHLPAYREHLATLEALVDQINWQFQTAHWKPIRFLVAHHDAHTVYRFLRMASVCIVSSLHDGMNLVAKEFVAAQDEGEGVLILSEFAGAARELADALLVNPYDTEGCAEAIYTALTMEPRERRARMVRMRRVVEEHNVYRWAASFLRALVATRNGTAPAAPAAVVL